MKTQLCVGNYYVFSFFLTCYATMCHCKSVVIITYLCATYFHAKKVENKDVYSLQREHWLHVDGEKGAAMRTTNNRNLQCNNVVRQRLKVCFYFY